MSSSVLKKIRIGHNGLFRNISHNALQRNSYLASITTYHQHQHLTYNHYYNNNISNTLLYRSHFMYNPYQYIPKRFQSESSSTLPLSTSNIDEVLLSKQEDPMVLKQKEELLRAFATQLSRNLKKYQNSRRMKLKYLLKKIYGCSTIEIKQYCAMFGIHEQTPTRDVPPLFWAGNKHIIFNIEIS